MTWQTPISADHPLRKAWEKYKITDDYTKTRQWALHVEHVEGSLWAAFLSGWFACEKLMIQSRQGE